MTDGMENFWDSLSQDEASSAEFIMEQLKDVPWAQPLLRDIRSNGGITQANKDRLFELRFGYALHAEGIVPRHEIPGEGGATIDFGFTSKGKSWAVELMRLGETQAVKAATRTSVDEHGIPWTKRELSTSAVDRRQSLEGETLKAVERICQKCESAGRPNKFLAPRDALHVILVDSAPSRTRRGSCCATLSAVLGSAIDHGGFRRPHAGPGCRRSSRPRSFPGLHE
jgi:hypothetical protein